MQPLLLGRVVSGCSLPLSISLSCVQVFLSIKGIYYQAEVQGQMVNWVTPYQFCYQVGWSVSVVSSGFTLCVCVCGPVFVHLLSIIAYMTVQCIMLP